MKLFEKLNIDCHKNLSLNPIIAFRQDLREYEEPQEVFQVRIDNQQEQIASTYLNGKIKIHSLEKKDLLREIQSNEEELPITSIRFRPHLYPSKCKRVLVSGGSDGNIIHWHCNSGKYLSKVNEDNNQILSMDFNTSGTYLATAGQDYKIRIYDENIKQLSQSLQGGYQELGHSNRIFSLKWINDNVLISGGWDNTILIWDLRQQKSCGSIHGANISGDSLDVRDDQILAGSYRNKDQLQIFSLKEQKLIKNIEWDPNYPSDNIYLYTAQFSKFKNQQYVIAGSSGKGQIKIFDAFDNFKSVATIDGFKKGCYSLDTSKSGFIAFGTANGEIYVLKFS